MEIEDYVSLYIFYFFLFSSIGIPGNGFILVFLLNQSILDLVPVDLTLSSSWENKHMTRFNEVGQTVFFLLNDVYYADNYFQGLVIHSFNALEKAVD